MASLNVWRSIQAPWVRSTSKPTPTTAVQLGRSMLLINGLKPVKCFLPLDTSTSRDGCELRILPWKHTCRRYRPKCTYTDDTSVSNRNRSQTRIRVGNRKTVDRSNLADTCTLVRRWSPHTWCFCHKDWGNIVLL